MAWSALFNYVFEALILLLIIFYTYVAEIKLQYLVMELGPPPLHRVLTRVLQCLAIGDFHHIM
jgi:hypothetical protein